MSGFLLRTRKTEDENQKKRPTIWLLGALCLCFPSWVHCGHSHYFFSIHCLVMFQCYRWPGSGQKLWKTHQGRSHHPRIACLHHVGLLVEARCWMCRGFDIVSLRSSDVCNNIQHLCIFKFLQVQQSSGGNLLFVALQILFTDDVPVGKRRTMPSPEPILSQIWLKDVKTTSSVMGLLPQVF